MLVTTLVASFMAFATAVAFAVTTDETVSLTPVQDNSIVMVDREWSENAGSNGRIRIKGNQHIVAFDFDFTPLKGRRVKSTDSSAHRHQKQSRESRFPQLLCPGMSRKARL